MLEEYVNVDRSACVTLNYEDEYCRLKELYEELHKENKQLKETVVNMAVALHRD